MPDRVAFGSAQPTQAVASDSASETVPGRVGTWNGEVVRLEQVDDAAALDDVAEDEDSDEDVEIEEKELREREITESIEDCDGEGLEAIQRDEVYLSKLPEFSARALGLFMAVVREHYHRAGHAAHDPAGDLLGRARERFPEPAHAFAALDAASKHMLAKGDPELASRLAEARDRLQDSDGPAIRAGLNTAVAAFELSGGEQDEARALRNLYQTTVFSGSGPASVYTGILQQFGVEKFPDGLRFLTRALGDDLAAAGPSVEPARLRELLAELSSLRVLDTVHDRCRELVRRVGKLGVGPMAVTDVMRHLLPLAGDPALGASQAAPLPRLLNVPADRLDAQIVFLREARDVLASLPIALYRDADARFAVLHGMQDALDALIEREEGAA